MVFSKSLLLPNNCIGLDNSALIFMHLFYSVASLHVREKCQFLGKCSDWNHLWRMRRWRREPYRGCVRVGSLPLGRNPNLELLYSYYCVRRIHRSGYARHLSHTHKRNLKMEKWFEIKVISGMEMVQTGKKMIVGKFCLLRLHAFESHFELWRFFQDVHHHPVFADIHTLPLHAVTH